MKELSLHILDIVENSFRAKASLVQLEIKEDSLKNKTSIKVIDDGVGMSELFLKEVTNPFKTTRTTRKVGLGLSLLKACAERCNGIFNIKSKEGLGTELFVSFEKNNIDLPPLGDIVGTIVALVGNRYYCDLSLKRYLDGKEYSIDTKAIKAVLECDDLSQIDILTWLKEFLEEKEKEL